MLKVIRKRQSSESHMTDNIKHIKIHPAVKENIPPDLCKTGNPNDNNMSVPDINIGTTTPKKVRENMKEQPVTPSTNFKLLASLAADLEYVTCVTPKSIKNEVFDTPMSCESDLSDLSAGKVNRKEKSLGIICTRFLAMYPMHPPPDEKIIVSLDDACAKLGVERRRLYDIVNVFEGIDILTKNAKNQYLWFGKNNLLKSLNKLKDAAIKENMLEKLLYVLETDVRGCRQSCILNDVKNFKMFESPVSSMFFSSLETKKEKSLGIMSQKFLMLFLVSSDKVISLGVAAKVLNGFVPRSEKAAQIKTQIRRLYDIANVLQSIGLIQKETSLTHCIRKPAFKYIGPDLKDYKGDLKSSISLQSALKNSKSRSLARHSSFQDICAVAEIEHQKLKDSSCNSAPPFDSAFINDKENVKTSFYNLQLPNGGNKKIKTASPVKYIPKVKIPVLVQPNLKFINLKKTAANPTMPYVIVNSLPVEKSDIKYTNSSHGNQTYFVINTIAPSKEVKTEAVVNQPFKKVSSPQTIILSSEQSDAILQSLNISLSSEQTAAILLNGASQSNSSDVPCNVLKIFNKSSPNLSESKNTMVSSQKDIELKGNGSSSINNTRSNTPSSYQTLDSPLSIPSGYVTPIPNVSSDISFISNSDVNDILKKIESQTNIESLNCKINNSNQENINMCNETSRSSATADFTMAYQNVSGGKKLVSNNYPTNSMNQVSQIISNDSCSNDSVNLEVSNIFKGKYLDQSLIQPKPFLFDEKTLLSPIKTANVPVQISVPSHLNTPPGMVPETVFVFNTTPASYQRTKVKDISNFVTVPTSFTGKNKSILFTNVNGKT